MSLAAEDAASDVTVASDLTAVIALQGLPFGRVVAEELDQGFVPPSSKSMPPIRLVYPG